MKDWQAFLDLKKKIDDFNETCPLLEMMTNKAMAERHWQRISALTKKTFDIESDTFTLGTYVMCIKYMYVYMLCVLNICYVYMLCVLNICMYICYVY